MVESLDARVEYVESRLTTCHTIRAKKCWIEECLKFFISQAPEIDDETLYQQALEQFLLADMTEASNPVIPAPISLKKEPFTLNGTFVVQMLFLIDIAESPYEQWRKLYNIRLDDVEEKEPNKQYQPKKKRMFKLELSDGNRTVSAMEYVVIPALTSKISPGVKLKIVGPLQVVNHILLIEPRNLEILGGDVDSLLVVNAYENVLLRALGKPTTETPITDYKENEVNQDARQDYSHIVVPRSMSSTLHSNNGPQNGELKLLDGINFEEEDEVDLEMLLQIEQQQNVRTANQSNPVTNATMNNPDDYDDDILAQVDLDMLENNARRNMEETAEVIEVENYRPIVIQRTDTELMEVTEIEDIQPAVRTKNLPVQTIVIPDVVCDKPAPSLSHCRSSLNDPVPQKVARVEPTLKLKFSDDDYEFKTVQGNNIITVDQYHSLSNANKIKRAYVIFGKVRNVLNNSMKISKKNWNLCVDIADDYSHQVLSVKFQTNVAEKLAGISVREMDALKKDSVQRPQLKDEIKSIIEKLFNTVSRMECFMKVETNCPPPRFELLVTELLEENAENNRRFTKKLKDENLSKVA